MVSDDKLTTTSSQAGGPRPYIPDAHLRPILEKISARLPDSVDIAGLPFSGKTFLLRHLSTPNGALLDHTLWLHPPYHREPWRLITAPVDFKHLHPDIHPLVYLYARFASVCQALLQAAAASEAAAHDEVPQELIAQLRLVPDWLRDELRPAVDPTAQISVAQAVDQTWRMICALGKMALRPVFLLDDFDLALEMRRAPETRMSYDDVAAMRPWRAVAAFVLTRERDLQNVNPQASASSFFQSITHISLTVLTEQDASAMLRAIAEEAQQEFPAEDIRFVAQLAGGHTYLLNLAGRALADIRTDLPPLTPLAEQQRAILELRLTVNYRGPFLVYENYLTAEEYSTLHALAKGTQQDRLSPAQRLLLSPLREKGLLCYDSATAHYEIFSKLFAAYLSAQPAPEQTSETADLPNLSDLERRLYDYLRRRTAEECRFEDVWNVVWNAEPGVEAAEMRRRIQVAVSRLRRKLKSSNVNEDIVSVRSDGYKLVPGTSSK
jgi:hypothetical protein